MSSNAEGEVTVVTQGKKITEVFLILSTTKKPKVSIKDVLYTSKTRTKYILKSISCQKKYDPPVKMSMHLWQLPVIDKYMMYIHVYALLTIFCGRNYFLTHCVS